MLRALDPRDPLYPLPAPCNPPWPVGPSHAGHAGTEGYAHPRGPVLLSDALPGTGEGTSPQQNPSQEDLETPATHPFIFCFSL